MKFLIPCACAVFILLSSPIPAAELTLIITSKTVKSGTLHVELYRVDESAKIATAWGDIESIRKARADYLLPPNSSKLSFSKLEPEQICARIFLDLNDNNQLDHSFIGLPMEPVGFTNNPSLLSGQPAPEMACFDLLPGDNTQSITLTHKKVKRRANKFK